MQQVKKLAQQDDHRALHNAITALAHGTEEFAARRMAGSRAYVQLLLAGKKLDEIA